MKKMGLSSLSSKNRSMNLIQKARRRHAENYEGVEKSREIRYMRNLFEDQKAIMMESDFYGRN